MSKSWADMDLEYSDFVPLLSCIFAFIIGEFLTWCYLQYSMMFRYFVKKEAVA